MPPENKALVTGGTGLVGSHLLVELLRRKIPVKAIYRSDEKKKHVQNIFGYYFDNPREQFDKIQWVRADINDIPSLAVAFQEVTHVYHAAGVVSFMQRDEPLMRKVNIEGTANMINLSLQSGIYKFCHVSSISVFGKYEDGKYIDEETPWNPELNDYGYAISKYGAEMEVWRGAQEGLQVSVVNPGVIIGPGFWQENTGRFYNLADNGFPYYSEGINGFIGVWDVVEALVEICNSPQTGERYILVSENMSFRDLFTQIAGQLQQPVPHKKITPFKASIAWRLARVISGITGKPPLISRHSAESALKIHKYNSEKFKNTFKRDFTPMREVIKKTAGYYLRDKKNPEH